MLRKFTFDVILLSKPVYLNELTVVIKLCIKLPKKLQNFYYLWQVR